MLFSIWIGKLLRALTRLKGGGGSALPGYWIERINPAFLNYSLNKLPDGVIIVTGTNGKTSTTKIIADLLTAHGYKVLTNRSGGNFVRGILSTVIKEINWRGKLNFDIAVFEQDEAYAVRFVRRYRPRGVVALNVGRDQLDRFGEIDKTAALIGEAVKAAKGFVVLNANDSRIAKLKNKARAPVHWFGHDENLAGHFASDDQHHAEEVDFFQATSPEVRLDKVSDQKIAVSIDQEPYELKTILHGVQNALNAVAGLTVLRALDPELSMEVTAEALAIAEPAFGRGETIKLKSGGQLKLQLVKNPASFRHNLNHLDEVYGAVGIAINDDYADGRDVSWLWDVDFQSLKDHNIICGGSRAYDMAVRLKYDGLKSVSEYVALSKFVPALINQAGDRPTVVLCTYTAMLKIRKLLKPLASEMSGGLKS